MMLSNDEINALIPRRKLYALLVIGCYVIGILLLWMLMYTNDKTLSFLTMLNVMLLMYYQWYYVWFFAETFQRPWPSELVSAMPNEIQQEDMRLKSLGRNMPSYGDIQRMRNAYHSD